MLEDKIRALPRSSKQWWRLNKELLNKKSKHCTIPPLKGTDGTWILDPTDKANLLATTFQKKSQLPDRKHDVLHAEVEPLMSSFHLVRARWARKILRALKVDKASGPDMIPVRIFLECADVLAPMVAILVRFILRTRCWPQIWRLHWIHPLYKKKAVSNASNYRGVHLTCVIPRLSKRCLPVCSRRSWRERRPMV